MKLNNRGFTLIELLIVVAIIGILASIALGKHSEIKKEKTAKAYRQPTPIEQTEPQRAPQNPAQHSNKKSGSGGTILFE